MAGEELAWRQDLTGRCFWSRSTLVVPVVVIVSETDSPVEGTGGLPGNCVEQALRGEAPGGAREPTRPARDGRSFHNGKDAGGRRWHGFPGEVGGQRIAVGRG